ncbi:MAG: hypothetical protein IJM59_04225 [Proteobacteria bacterium]|nr:hypothetical protein [Pseudomonadota bacterium]
MKYLLLTILTAALLIPGTVCAQESYADVRITTPPHWSMQEMQTFSGTVPSRAWVYAKGDEEVTVSILVTEGILHGLEGQDPTTLVKLYTEAFAVGWGAKIKGEPEGTKAAFCGGEAGYKLEAAFGEKTFEYYGCLMLQKDHSRVATAVTWVPQGTSEQIPAKRLMTFIEAIRLNDSQD